MGGLLRRKRQTEYFRIGAFPENRWSRAIKNEKSFPVPPAVHLDQSDAGERHQLASEQCRRGGRGQQP